MGDDRRVYSDEEFALILRKAAELAEPADPSSRSSGVLAVARSYWKSSTRSARDRLSRVMDSVSRFLTNPARDAS